MLKIKLTTLAFITFLLSGSAYAQQQSSNDDFFPQGRYLESPAQCKKLLKNKNAEFTNMLTIKGNEISGWEFGCTIKTKQKITDGYKIQADCGGEGDNWKATTELKTDGTKYIFGNMFNVPDVPPQTYYFCEQNNSTASTATAASKNLINPISPNAYLFEILENNSHRASWNKITARNIPKWLDRFSKTKNGTCFPGEQIELDGEKYQLSSVCEPHNCGNAFYVMFDSSGLNAWGMLKEYGKSNKFYGEFDNAKKNALLEYSKKN